jgi:enamine deaminase RidA (YjgF/YER057c/UK114 family)
MKTVSFALAAALLSAPALAGSRQQATVLMSKDPQGRAFQEDWGYADAVVSGDTIYLSGVVAGQREGETLEAAYTRAFERIGKILARAGASWDDVIEMTSFHTDLQSQMPAIVAVKKRYMRPPAIAWTAIEISRLIPDRGITEIKIVARKMNGG